MMCASSPPTLRKKRVLCSLICACLIVLFGGSNLLITYRIQSPRSRPLRGMQSTRRQLYAQSRYHDVPSPYEARYPGSPLPSWARKKTYSDLPDDKGICFVHVGKGKWTRTMALLGEYVHTRDMMDVNNSHRDISCLFLVFCYLFLSAGGSTLGCSLGFNLHCEDKVLKEEKSILYNMTSHVFHKNVYDCSDDSAYYLLSVRDPIARALSAFNYDRPDETSSKRDLDRLGPFYLGCPFYHFDDLVKNGLTKHGQASNRCKRIARNSLQGTLPHYMGPSHFEYNYQYYYEVLPEDANILVIRNEHIEVDWNSIEVLLSGSNEETNISFARTNVNTWIDQGDLYISPESITTLCQVLCNEIQVYKKILRSAQNLNEEEIHRSLIELMAKCPVEAVTDECPKPLPNISAKIEDNIGYESLDEEEEDEEDS